MMMMGYLEKGRKKGGRKKYFARFFLLGKLM